MMMMTNNGVWLYTKSYLAWLKDNAITTGVKPGIPFLLTNMAITIPVLLNHFLYRRKSWLDPVRFASNECNSLTFLHHSSDTPATLTEICLEIRDLQHDHLLRAQTQSHTG